MCFTEKECSPINHWCVSENMLKIQTAAAKPARSISHEKLMLTGVMLQCMNRQLLYFYYMVSVSFLNKEEQKQVFFTLLNFLVSMSGEAIDYCIKTIVSVLVLSTTKKNIAIDHKKLKKCDIFAVAPNVPLPIVLDPPLQRRHFDVET